MTRKEAIDALDILDKYWNRPRWVNQTIGTIYHTKRRQCGCFGAHCARAYGIGVNYHWDEGQLLLEEISEGLGVDLNTLSQILKDKSGIVNPFGTKEWFTSPNEAWPMISNELRAIAA